MKKQPAYTMKEKLFLWPGETANWHFLPITKKIGIEIKEKYGSSRRGFGSLPVEVTLGNSVWKTSIFPEKTSGSYILPVKATVRRVEGIEANEYVSFSIVIQL